MSSVVQTWFGPDKLTPKAGAIQFPGLGMQVRARACITRIPTSHSNSMATQHYDIVKYSFSMTKKESSNKDCIVVFLAEKEEEIVVDELMAVEEEKITIWTRTCTSILAIVAKC